MSSRLLEALAPRDDSVPALWIDFFAYAQRVLLGGAEVPWLRPPELARFYGDAHSLLGPSVACLPLRALFDAWLDSEPRAVAAMRAGRRTGYALKQLLSEDEPRKLGVEILRALRASLPAAVPLVVSLPAPDRWVASAHARANGAEPAEISADDTECASMYVADWLRSLAGSAVDGLLLEDDREVVLPIAMSQPIVNVARHYRWYVGVLAPRAAAEGACEELDFRILRLPAFSGVAGVMVPEGFWRGDAPPPRRESQFYCAVVPETAAPERVLDAVARLRAGPPRGSEPSCGPVSADSVPGTKP